MLRILLILFILCSISSVYSQTKLNGKLVDAFSGEPIEAAKVKIKGLNKGGMTDKVLICLECAIHLLGKTFFE